MDAAAARALISATRELADAFEASLGHPTHDVDVASSRTVSSAEPIDYDPERDLPPFAPDPEGTQREKDLNIIIMFGRLYALNIRMGRGASRRDLREIAIAAKYTDGRAWNGYSKYATTRDDAGELELNKTGHEWMMNAATQQNIILPNDLATWRDDRS